jgi:hypothetical protein
MSNMIDRPGTFRGRPLEWGVSETKNGYPQFVCRFSALEYYDEEKGEYTDWSAYDQEITGYFVLYTKDKNGQWQELLNAKQIKKVLGWTGLDFGELAAGKYNEISVLFRVEDSEYNGNRSLKLTWIDGADASPTKTLPKFDADKLKGLTAKMGGALSATAGNVPPKAPVKAPAKAGKKALPKATTTSAPAAASTTPPVAAPPIPASANATKPPAPTTEDTKDSAWAAVNQMNGESDEKLAEIWIVEATKIGKPEDQFTPTDWATVKNAVLDQVSRF